VLDARYPDDSTTRAARSRGGRSHSETGSADTVQHTPVSASSATIYATVSEARSDRHQKKPRERPPAWLRARSVMPAPMLSDVRKSDSRRASTTARRRSPPAWRAQKSLLSRSPASRISLANEKNLIRRGSCFPPPKPGLARFAHSASRKSGMPDWRWGEGQGCGGGADTDGRRLTTPTPTPPTMWRNISALVARASHSAFIRPPSRRAPLAISLTMRAPNSGVLILRPPRLPFSSCGWLVFRRVLAPR